MQVFLEAIKFNHNPDSATGDAFGIRENESTPLTDAEWRRFLSLNPEDSPAAYARNAVNNRTLTIKARFSCDQPGQTVWIRAVDGRLFPDGQSLGTGCLVAVLRPLLRRLLQTNVLGEVSAEKVEFRNLQSDDITFELKHVRIQEAGVGIDDIIWHWQFSQDRQTWSPITTTSHRIYTVVDLPGPPWRPNSNSLDTQLPWTSVLDRACTWAAGTTNLESAAFQITEAINSLGPAFVKYDVCNNGAPHFVKDDPLRFDCQKFLNLLASDPSVIDRLVNCDDCAAMVCTFANVLGCSFPESEIRKPNASEFSLRRHQKIGLCWEDFDQFDYHMIAWAGADQDEVSDACLKLEGSPDNTGDPIPLVASNLPFAGSDGYRQRLVVPGEQCEFFQKFYRRIGMGFDDPALLEPADLKRQTLLLADAFSQLYTLENWTQVDLRFVPKDSLEIYWELAEGPDKPVLRLDIQLSQTKEGTDSKLKHKLSRFELPGMNLKADAGFGEMVFSNQSGFAILFSRDQFVALLRNVGGSYVPLWQVARIIDTFLLSLPTLSPTANTSRKGGN